MTHSCITLWVPASLFPQPPGIDGWESTAVIKLEECVEGAEQPLALDNDILTLATRGHTKTTWLPESWGTGCGWTSKSAKLGLLLFCTAPAYGCCPLGVFPGPYFPHPNSS